MDGILFCKDGEFFMVSRKKISPGIQNICQNHNITVSVYFKIGYLALIDILSAWRYDFFVLFYLFFFGVMMYNSGPFTQLYKYGPVFFQQKFPGRMMIKEQKLMKFRALLG